MEFQVKKFWVVLTAEPFIENTLLEEVHKALKKLKKNKSLGETLINAEMIKVGGPT